MTDLKPFIDALKAAFNDDTGFLDSNYTDIGDDDVSRVVLDGEWDFAAIARALHNQGFIAPTPPVGERCGAWGGCPAPRGHNMGQVDVPENHAPPEPLGEECRQWTEGHPDGPRLDSDGVAWYACDPYPTWYRWEGGRPFTKARSHFTKESE